MKNRNAVRPKTYDRPNYRSTEDRTRAILRALDLEADAYRYQREIEL